MTVPPWENPDIIEAAAKARFGKLDQPWTWEDASPEVRAQFIEAAADNLAAVGPRIEAATREAAAAEIAAQPERYRIDGDPDSWAPYFEGWDDAMDAAAAVVRSGNPKESNE